MCHKPFILEVNIRESWFILGSVSTAQCSLYTSHTHTWSLYIHIYKSKGQVARTTMLGIEKFLWQWDVRCFEGDWQWDILQNGLFILFGHTSAVWLFRSHAWGVAPRKSGYLPQSQMVLVPRTFPSLLTKKSYEWPCLRNRTCDCFQLFHWPSHTHTHTHRHTHTHNTYVLVAEQPGEEKRGRLTDL